MSRRIVVTSLVMITALSVVLTGWTFSRWVDSRLAVRHFDVTFVGLQHQEGSRAYQVDLMLRNEGGVRASVELVTVLLRWDGRLIAQGEVRPVDLVMSPGDTAAFNLEVFSDLDEGDLPAVSEDEAEPWSVRAYLKMTHPVRDEPITLYRQRPLNPDRETQREE